ncbi:hypothetical protein FSP39_012132 [Pinctada imbricata]|uniref:Uncharacterized protein n=1 Tax=Pinctada imbricata TaxID=66713 RepID=A0AA89C5B2_PINIB|nr:hypothetical protein FSP39_012132 [Pinctada imbricata]
MLREFGTKESHIGIVTKISVVPILPHQILIARVHNVKIYEKIAEIEVNNAPYLPTFSVTENYVIVYVPPFYIDVAQYEVSLILKDSLEFRNSEPSFIYVIEISTGKVTTLKSSPGFVLHHINAKEVNDNQINMDVCLYNDAKILDNYDLSVLVNKTMRDSLQWRPKVTRMQLDLTESSVRSVTFNNSEKVAYSAELEFPSINERYKSKHYCFVYGIVFSKNNTIFSQWKVVKKNLCNDTRDLEFDVPSIYPSKVTFVSDPTGSKEDDGYLLMVAFNTVTNSSDLVIIDARTMLINNTAALPTFVPFTYSGGLFHFPKQ